VDSQWSGVFAPPVYAGVAGHRVAYTHHSPPEGVGVAGEMAEAAVVRGRVVFLRQVDEIRREDEAEEPDVQRRYQLLLETVFKLNKFKLEIMKTKTGISMISCSSL